MLHKICIQNDVRLNIKSKCKQVIIISMEILMKLEFNFFRLGFNYKNNCEFEYNNII